MTFLRPLGPQTPFLLTGGVCGLTWAAGLRGWMEQLARGTGTSEFTWLTVLLLLLPATVVGALLGRAAYLRTVGRPAPTALIWTPAILASALADPTLLRALVTNGQGSGALIVVGTALAAGYTFSRSRWTMRRVVTGLATLLGLATIGGTASIAAPLNTARGVWVSLLGVALVLLLGLAAVLPYPPVRPARRAGWWVAGGALGGLAWTASLRAFMADVAGVDSVVHRGETFGFILAPGVVAGALLGWAEYLRRTGGRPRWRLLTVAPLALWAVVVRDLVTSTSVDTAPLVVPLIALAGGYAMCGRGAHWRRTGAAVAFGAVLLAMVVLASRAEAEFRPTTAHGFWALAILEGLITVLAVAASAPMRPTWTAQAPTRRPESMSATPQRTSHW